MLAMLTDMNLIPHRHFGMPGDIQKHTLVFTVIAAGLLAAFFDLSRIASLGAIFYLVMDMIIHWGVYRHLKDDVGAKSWILLSAIILDLIVLGAFLTMKAASDPMIIAISFAGIAGFFAFEKYYLSHRRSDEHSKPSQSDHAH